MLKPLCKETNNVNYIIRQFFKGSSNFELRPEQIQDLTWINQETILDSTFNSPLVKKYPVNSSFSRLFLKKLIHYLESSQEVHDDLYTSLCTAMKSDPNGVFCYRHYIIGNTFCNIITMKETNNLVVNGTTGMRTWEAAKILADWALCNIEVFKNKKVLELGSGIGFTGITVTKFCDIQRMLLSDCHEDVIRTIKTNIAINFPTWIKDEVTENYKNKNQEIGVITLDWNQISISTLEMCPDVVIGADIIYDPTILKPLFNVIQSLVKMNNEVVIYVAGVMRQEETLNTFLQLLKSSNLQYLQFEQSENTYLEWDCRIQRYLLKINLRNEH